MSPQNAIDRVASPENQRAWQSLYQELARKISLLPGNLENTVPEARSLMEETTKMGRLLSTLPMLTQLPDGAEKVYDTMMSVHEHYLAAQDALAAVTDRVVIQTADPSFEKLIENVETDAAESPTTRDAVQDVLRLARAMQNGMEANNQGGDALFTRVNGVVHPNFARIANATTIIDSATAMLRAGGIGRGELRTLSPLLSRMHEKLNLISMTDPTKGRARQGMAAVRQYINDANGPFDSKPLRLGGILLASSVLLVSVGTSIAKPILKKGEKFAGPTPVDIGWGAALLGMLYPSMLKGASFRARETIAAEAKQKGAEISVAKEMTATPKERTTAFLEAQRLKANPAVRALLQQEEVTSEALAHATGETSMLTRVLTPLDDKKRAKALTLFCAEMTPDMREALRILLDDPARIVEGFEHLALEHLATDALA